ncbi:hypothetical protein LXA43DRAFT_1067745 [Ganoderma leucocontextum]|nr:hypothetical protein LXA43DRAFT_1067745 [Ganoderma leucocontextum]
MVSSNLNDYNTEAWVHWDRYADCLNNFFAGRGPHPGEPAAGYREVYCVRHRHAPLPENRPAPAAPEHARCRRRKLSPRLLVENVGSVELAAELAGVPVYPDVA